MTGGQIAVTIMVCTGLIAWAAIHIAEIICIHRPNRDNRK